jgi:hypothetical protein
MKGIIVHKLTDPILDNADNDELAEFDIFVYFILNISPDASDEMYKRL